MSVVDLNPIGTDKPGTEVKLNSLEKKYDGIMVLVDEKEILF